ncbi:MAG: beta-lactamase family protein [Proteobacteria bacterium]|nr:beta-lactamase family protein [Pseudomonadota bacterium]
MTDVSQIVERAAERFALPGGVVAIVAGGRSTVYPFGVRRLGEAAPVDANTTFSIASCSKALTACAVAQLVDEGKLRWDDPVHNFLPTFTLYDSWITAHITLRDLLGMRTGLGRGGICEWGSNRSLPLAEIFRRLRHTRPVCGFRERYVYTNVAFSALSEIVRRVADREFPDVLQQRIFAPLGMDDAFVSDKPGTRAVNCAIPHTRIDGVTAALAEPRCGGRLGESCGFLSGTDAAAWMRYVLDGTPKLMGEATFAEMFMPQSLGVAEPRLGRSYQHYCMGWEACDYFGDRIFCHEGGEFGASSRTMLNRDKGLGVAVYLNVSLPAVRALCLEIYDRLTDRQPRDWSGELPVWMAAAAEAGAAQLQRAYGFEFGAPSPFVRGAFEGTYSHPANGVLRLVAEADGYRAVFEDASVLDGMFEPLGGTIYRLAPSYAGMRDNLKGRSRVRFDENEGRRSVDVMGVGVFAADAPP